MRYGPLLRRLRPCSRISVNTEVILGEAHPVCSFRWPSSCDDKASLFILSHVKRLVLLYFSTLVLRNPVLFRESRSSFLPLIGITC